MKKRHLIFLLVMVMLFATNVYAKPLLNATKDDCIEQGLNWDEKNGMCYSTTNKQSTTSTPSQSTQTSSNISKIKCGNVTGIPKKIPRITSDIVKILQVAVPIILVLFGSLDLAKGIVAGKEDEIKKGQGIFIKRLITGAIVFFVVVVVKFLVSVISDSNAGYIVDCIDCFISNDCTDEIVE